MPGSRARWSARRPAARAATWQDTWPILRGCGRHALPLPLAETILGGWLAAEAGLDVPAGPLTVADGTALAALDAPARLTGTVDAVPWGGNAGHIVVVGRNVAAASVAVVARGAVSVARDRNIGRDPRDTVHFCR